MKRKWPRQFHAFLEGLKKRDSVNNLCCADEVGRAGHNYFLHHQEYKYLLTQTLTLCFYQNTKRFSSSSSAVGCPLCYLPITYPSYHLRASRRCSSTGA